MPVSCRKCGVTEHKEKDFIEDKCVACKRLAQEYALHDGQLNVFFENNAMFSKSICIGASLLRI
jgi:phage FluMu protein Com